MDYHQLAAAGEDLQVTHSIITVAANLDDHLQSEIDVSKKDKLETYFLEQKTENLFQQAVAKQLAIAYIYANKYNAAPDNQFTH